MCIIGEESVHNMGSVYNAGKKVGIIGEESVRNRGKIVYIIGGRKCA